MGENDEWETWKENFVNLYNVATDEQVAVNLFRFDGATSKIHFYYFLGD